MRWGRRGRKGDISDYAEMRKRKKCSTLLSSKWFDFLKLLLILLNFKMYDYYIIYKSSIFAFFLRTSHFLLNKNGQIKLILITPSKTLFLYKSNKIFNNFLFLLFLFQIKCEVENKNIYLFYMYVYFIYIIYKVGW